MLVHQDTELTDDDFCERARAALADPDVGLVGCVAAVGVRTIAWWEGAATLAHFVQRFENEGGGVLHGLSWDPEDAPPYARIGEVDTLDGFLLVLSPWVVRNLRFDESLGPIHGYDFDFCLQVRESGRKVITADIRAHHDHALEAFSDPQSWIEAHIRVAEKWDGRMPGVGWMPGDWRERALRAAAERDHARLLGTSARLLADAELAFLDRALREAEHSISWRISAPLRTLARARQRLSGGAPAPRRLQADLALGRTRTPR